MKKNHHAQPVRIRPETLVRTQCFTNSEGNPVTSFNIAFHSNEEDLLDPCRLLPETRRHRSQVPSQGSTHRNRDPGQASGNRRGVSRSTYQLIANTLEFIKTTAGVSRRRIQKTKSPSDGKEGISCRRRPSGSSSRSRKWCLEWPS